ncbi:MAG: hypothetical protein RLZZ162_1243, partial [Verrucomicrobiota bacterium]
MKNLPLLVFGVAFTGVAFAQTVTRDVRYAESKHGRHVLDVYAPAGAKDAPVVFWVHGGGWQGGDKANVQVKPKVFSERGFVFVALNHRLLPTVEMG